MVIYHNEGLESQAKLRDEEETIRKRNGYPLIQVTRLIVLKGYQKQKECVAQNTRIELGLEVIIRMG